MIRGIVTELHRWPVKSMGGEPVDELDLDGRGAAGDRSHALFDDWPPAHPAPRRLTARQSPGLLRWHASYGGGPVDLEDPPAPVLTAPGGARFAWDDPALPAALAQDLGRDVTLRRDAAGQQDLPRSLLVTTQASLDAVAAALGRPLDLRRFRTNVHVVLRDVEPYAEEGWEGRRMTVGDAELELLHPCERCVIPTRDPDTAERYAELLRWLHREHRGLFGINARPLGAAHIAVGDQVRVH